MGVKLTKQEKNEVYGKLPRGGLNGEHYYNNRVWTRERQPPEANEPAT